MRTIMRSIKQNFRAKLILCFILCAVIPMLCIGITSYTISMVIAKDKLLEGTTLSSKQVTRSINERMKQVENMAETVHFNMYMLNKTPEYPLTAYLAEFSSVRNNINTLMHAFDVYHISVFVEPDKIISEEGINFLGYDDMERYQIEKEEFESLGVATKWKFSNKMEFPHVVTQSKKQPGFLTCYRSDITNVGIYNYIFGIHLTSNEISEILIDSFADSEINAYIIDGQGTIVAARNIDEIGTKIPTEMSDAYNENADKNTFEYKKNHILLDSIASDWKLVTEIPDAYIRQNTNILVNIIILSLIVIVIITIAVILFISATLSRKINLLSAAMEQVEFDRNSRTTELPGVFSDSLETGDEIDRLSIAFREMLDTLDDNFREILDLTVKEEKLNYSLLQSQINPHFLYNILGSIRSLLSLNELQKADRMLVDLSKFYKGMLRKSDDLIPIREEIEISSLYLEMEALCKDHIFTWNIRMDEGIENFLICKFTLQPILENSIKHGLPGNNTKMHINIDISYQDERIEILVSDDGTGISPNRLKEIQEDLSNKTVRYDKHFGISNINNRIASSLQEHGTVNIESTLGEGTFVQIEIPQIIEEEKGN